MSQLTCIRTRSRILDGTTYGLPQSLNCSLLIDKSVSSVTQFCPNFYDPMECSVPGFPVHHQLPEFIQTHVHRVGDAIKPSHPLSSSSTPTFNFPRISSVQLSCSVVSDSLRPHGLQRARLPCPSPTPRACSNSCSSLHVQ